MTRPKKGPNPWQDPVDVVSKLQATRTLPRRGVGSRCQKTSGVGITCQAHNFEARDWRKPVAHCLTPPEVVVACTRPARPCPGCNMNFFPPLIGACLPSARQAARPPAPPQGLNVATPAPPCQRCLWAPHHHARDFCGLRTTVPEIFVGSARRVPGSCCAQHCLSLRQPSGSGRVIPLIDHMGPPRCEDHTQYQNGKRLERKLGKGEIRTRKEKGNKAGKGVLERNTRTRGEGKGGGRKTTKEKGGAEGRPQTKGAGRETTSRRLRKRPESKTGNQDKEGERQQSQERDAGYEYKDKGREREGEGRQRKGTGQWGRKGDQEEGPGSQKEEGKQPGKISIVRVHITRCNSHVTQRTAHITPVHCTHHPVQFTRHPVQFTRHPVQFTRHPVPRDTLAQLR
eukprot:363451-Chlamydomonas_euryale.AAC.5